MRRFVGFLVMLIVCGLALSTAFATQSRSSPRVTELPAGSQIFGYQLSADAEGSGTLVWSTSSFVGGYADSLIRVSQQNAAGKWSAPEQLGGLNQSLNPVLAESQSGAAVIVWSYVQGGRDQRTVLQAVTRSSASAGWSAPQTIWSTGVADGALVAAGIDSAGHATIVWTLYGSVNPAIWSIGLDARTAAATAPARLIAAGAGGTDVTLAVNGAGEALLCWQRQLGLTPHKNALPTVHAAEMTAYRTTAGLWLTPHQLAAFSYQGEPAGSWIWAPSSPSSTVTANGTAATAWLAGGVGAPAAVQISTRNPATGRWSPPHTLNTTASGEIAVAPGPGNSLLALWPSGENGTLVSTASRDGIHWSPASPLRGSQHDFAPFLASDPAGDEALALTGRHAHILSTTRTASGQWPAPKLTGTGFNPEAAVSPSGSVTLVWEHGIGAHSVLQTRTDH